MNINSILSKLLGGNKTSRDRKLIQPLVDEVLAAYPAICELSSQGLTYYSGNYALKPKNCKRPYNTRPMTSKKKLQLSKPK